MMKRNTALTALWVVAFLCMPSAGIGAQIGALPRDAASMQREISERGAAALVQKLFETETWYELMDKISSGDPDWIDVAIVLSTGADGGAGEELQDALFLGLRTNPRYELTVLPTEESNNVPLALYGVCGGLTDTTATYSAAVDEMNQVEAAVRKVEDKSLKSKKEFCLRQLEDGKAALKHAYGVK